MSSQSGTKVLNKYESVVYSRLNTAVVGTQNQHAFRKALGNVGCFYCVNKWWSHSSIFLLLCYKKLITLNHEVLHTDAETSEPIINFFLMCALVAILRKKKNLMKNLKECYIRRLLLLELFELHACPASFSTRFKVHLFTICKTSCTMKCKL